MPTKRILIVDDEESIQIVVQFGIQMTTDWVVLAASSGSKGIQMARTERPDVILLDASMPEMDGIATFHALHSYPETAEIPVIFLTAKAQTSDQKKFSDLGVSGVITKPFNSLYLPDRIVKLLDWSL
ncbi:response regulator [Tumidithrix elongata RA019]|uniref:Response regulator n=1 Tax=Tumidithrix elongata BACA0141 TaxID=2716417 RepID=A0AAW9PRL9_9CYAN|nr:response regulator [Tumidithrix elongata RA019]